MLRCGLSIIIILFTCGISFGQKQKEHLVQLSGVLVSMDSLNKVSYATVANKTTHEGTVADYYGYFSIVARPGDTLLFNAFGFNPGSYILPDTLSQVNYSIIHVMEPDTLVLPKVNIYPWPSRKEFAHAFVNMHPYHDAIRRVQQNLSGEQLAAIAERLPTNPSISYKWAMNQRQTKIYTKGQSPVNNLLNPFAWANFIKSWKDGDFQRQSNKHSRAYRYY